MNTANILTDKLQHFIYELRQAGYNIGVTQFLQAQNLILSLANQGKLPPLAQLKTLLSPILCHSRQEQQEFGWRFDNWLKTIEDSQEIRSSKVIAPEKPQPVTNKWRIAILLLLLMIAISIFGYYQWMIYLPTASPEKEVPKAEQAKQEQPIEPLSQTPQSTDTSKDDIEPSPLNQPIEPAKEDEKSKPKIRLIDWILWLILPILLLFWLGRKLWRWLVTSYLARKYTTALPALLKQLPVKKFEQQLFQSQSIHFSTSLIVDIQRFLAPLLRPRYHVTIGQHTYLPFDEQNGGIPDILSALPTDEIDEEITVATTNLANPLVGELSIPKVVTECCLEVRDTVNKEVITVIEVLSPANKKGREGRALYERKRLKVLASLTNLVEIDLIRAGKPFPMKIEQTSDYRIVVSRGWQRPQADIYLFGVRKKIPDFPIPLAEGETEPVLPLNQILHTLYDLGGYDLAVDYSQKPEPLLADEDAKWAEQILKN